MRARFILIFLVVFTIAMIPVKNGWSQGKITGQPQHKYTAPIGPNIRTRGKSNSDDCKDGQCNQTGV